MPHHLGMGRHLFLDVAVTDPGVGAALTARPSPSSSSSGVAAELRAQKKAQKYEGLAAAVDSSFCPAVIERYGAVCDALLGLTSSDKKEEESTTAGGARTGRKESATPCTRSSNSEITRAAAPSRRNRGISGPLPPGSHRFCSRSRQRKPSRFLSPFSLYRDRAYTTGQAKLRDKRDY